VTTYKTAPPCGHEQTRPACAVMRHRGKDSAGADFGVPEPEGDL